MYGITLAHAISLRPPSRSRTILTFSLVGITSVLSWPFAGALAIVLVLHDVSPINFNRDEVLDWIQSMAGAASVTGTALVISFNFLVIDPRLSSPQWIRQRIGDFRSCHGI